MTTWLAVILGGAVGTAARHAVNIVVARFAGAASPLATATVNLIGSFVAGMLAGALASGRLVMTPATRTFVFVGILGGFTTFSSLMLDGLTVTSGG